jgi:DNA-binding beta-propeller fold protein YncE
VLSQCRAGTFPGQPAYDPVNHFVYVPNGGSANISVIASPCTLHATISLPVNAQPLVAAFCPQNNEIYVVDENLNQVYVISGTTVVATVGGGHFNAPTTVTWDPGDSVMLVANFGWSNLTAISGTSIAGYIAVGSQPSAIAYDPYYNTILVNNFGSSNITIISEATFPFSSTHTSTTAGGGEEGIVYDPADHLDYVAGYSLSDVVVIDGLGGLVGIVNGTKGAIHVAFDQATLSVFVANRGSTSIYSISGTTVVKKYFLGVGAAPDGVAYSDFAGKTYATSTSNNEVYELD